MMAWQSLEPHGLHSPKAHLGEYGYAIMKNALKHAKHNQRNKNRANCQSSKEPAL